MLFALTAGFGAAALAAGGAYLAPHLVGPRHALFTPISFARRGAGPSGVVR